MAKNGNKHDNGVHEQGTDETVKAYQEDTPGQAVEKYVKENQKAYHDSKKTFSQIAINETLDTLQQEKTNLLDNPFRLGSMMYFETINEARRLVGEDRYKLTEVDKNILDTDIGQFEVYEGELVPLDCPQWESIDEDKEPELNKPKVGGPKKYYVYVKDPQTDKVKKITWGDTTGLKVKLGNEKARKSFAARHKCSQQKDKTTASYWACRLPYYAKQLGLSDGGNFYW